MPIHQITGPDKSRYSANEKAYRLLLKRKIQVEQNIFSTGHLFHDPIIVQYCLSQLSAIYFSLMAHN